MTTASPPAPPPSPPTPPGPPLRVATPGQLAWLSSEMEEWRRAGLLSDAQATEILRGYHATRRVTLARLVLGLGAGFVGFGLIWLVAANLDQLHPLVRLAVVVTIWLGVLAAAEWLAGRREHGGTIPSPVVGAARGIAALAFGAVVFQAAQSLQVPAFEPALVGLWSLGALTQAYVVRSVAALVVGVVTGAAWTVFSAVQHQPSGLGVVLAFGAAAVLATALGALHQRSDRRETDGFAPTWRDAGATLALVALFVAAVPYTDADGLAWSMGTVLLAAAALVATLVALVRTSDTVRWEPPAAMAIGVVALGLVLWESDTSIDAVGPNEWLHAGVSVLAFVAAATWVAVLGVWRDSWRLTAVALAGVVVFTTFQAFAVFAPIVEGAWLFLILGGVFLATGFTVDRVRRELAETLEVTPS